MTVEGRKEFSGMAPWQIIDLKHLISGKLLEEILEEAAKMNVKKYPRVRFVLEFNYGPNGDIIDAGVEPRYRRSLK